MKTKKLITFVSAMALSMGIFAQSDSLALQQNSADKMLASESKLTIGGYAQIDYNQGFDNVTRSNGLLDVHRMVMLFGYRFNERTQFITELEFEHVSELYVEQAFLQYKINSYVNFKGGLILIPMGLINEYHEPPTYNGVERPLVDNYISPTTWREIGAGFTGTIATAGVKYQVYVVNGFNSYNGAGKLNGKNGLRGGRQKGAESFVSSPNLSGRVDYFGIKNLQLGASVYFGNTQSTLYNGIDKNDDVALAKADSSIVGISMYGLDARYNWGKLQVKGQYYYNFLTNTEQYNAFTKNSGVDNDLGSALRGWYLEAAYGINLSKKNAQELVPFARLEYYNTQQQVSGTTVQNDAYKNNIITAGLGWKMTENTVIKADVQFIKSGVATEYNKTFNAGIGVMF